VRDRLTVCTSGCTSTFLSSIPPDALSQSSPAGEEANEKCSLQSWREENQSLRNLPFTTGDAGARRTLGVEPPQAELEKAYKEGKLKEHEELKQIAEARKFGMIDAEQALQLERDYALRRKVIMVDDFAPEQLRSGK
jgi:hypothetical protein